MLILKKDRSHFRPQQEPVPVRGNASLEYKERHRHLVTGRNVMVQKKLEVLSTSMSEEWLEVH
jgi:hypothetical protein